MAYVWRTYECRGPSGRRKPHTFEIMLQGDEKPSFCAKCGAPVGDIKAIPGTHSVGKSDINKAVDLTYQLVEESSAERARLTGNKNFKVTNMKDHLREGDVAVSLPNNTVTQFMAEASNRGIGYGWGGGGGLIAPTVTKPLPVKPNRLHGGLTGPGHVGLAAIQGEMGRTHQSKVAEVVGRESTPRDMIKAGQINKRQAR